MRFLQSTHWSQADICTMYKHTARDRREKLIKQSFTHLTGPMIILILLNAHNTHLQQEENEGETKNERIKCSESKRTRNCTDVSYNI